MDYTKQITVDTTGTDLIEFDAAKIQFANIKADSDWLLFFNSLQGNGYKVLSGVAIAFTHRDYTEEAKAQHKKTRVLGKVAAGSTTAYVAYVEKP